MFGYKHFLITIKTYFWRLYSTFGGHILLLMAITTFGGQILISTAIYYFWRLYTSFDGSVLLLTAIYHIRRLCITFDGYILLLALRYCNFARIQVFPAISFLCGLNTTLEFNINLLLLIHFGFFCNSMVSPVSFNLPFWKHCFIRNTQVLKMLNF